MRGQQVGKALTGMPDTAISEVFRSLRIEYQQVLFTEAVGLFWILAELCILFVVRMGRRLLAVEDLSSNSIPLGNEKKRAIVWGGFFIVFSSMLLGRHLFDSPLHGQLAQFASGEDVARLRQALSEQASLMRMHYAVWAFFVTVWVVLETCIVYNGWRGYRHLARLLAARRASPLGVGILPLVALGVAAVGLCVAFGTAYASETGAGMLRGAMNEAQAANAVYRNALHLYLRLAGSIWIVVEWLAALVLWRSYRLIARALRGKEPRG